MGLWRDIQVALREGLDELIGTQPTRDEVDEVTTLLEADLAEARAELDLARADADRLEAALTRERADAERLRDQAQAAVDRGDDDTGRDLIRRRRRALRGVEILEAQRGEHQQLAGLLGEHVEQLEDKLQELSLKRDYLRAKGRLRGLQERYERYRRDFAFEDEDPGEPAEAPDAEPSAVPAERMTAPRRRGQHNGDPVLATRHGLGEVTPTDHDDEPQLRRAPEPDPDDEGEPGPWDRPPRNIALERERILRTIERRQSSAEFEAAIDDELQRLKATQPAAAAPVAAAPAETAPVDAAPTAPETEAGDEPGPDH